MMQDFMSPEQKKFVESMTNGTDIDRVVFEQVVMSDQWRTFRMEFSQENGLEAMCFQTKEFISKFPDSWKMKPAIANILDIVDKVSISKGSPRMDFLGVLANEMESLGF